MPTSLITNSVSKGVSVITCTNKPIFMNNIFKNYQNQAWSIKELIIILNKDNMELKKWQSKLKGAPNIFIYQLPEQLSLGDCLNFAVDKTKYDYIATFDDDDYYGPQYISQMMSGFEKTGADIIGKKTHFTYFEKDRALYLRFPNQENKYVNWVCGGKKIVKRKVYDRVRFHPISIGEDVQFCKDSWKQGFKIHSTDRYNFVYVRRANPLYHTWNASKALMKSCKFITFTDDYTSFCIDPKTTST
ncbi:MAG: family 2 glycosyl transferase [Bacillota bacterium]|nr:family 2 glycosyl transferase [Bacillota bacterium]